MHDCLIIGGGVVGLSLAYELARRGRSVRVVDRQMPGRESSWAGAGIFPPAPTRPDASPLDKLSAFSLRLHADWAARLRDETEIDNGYRRCGGLYLADTDALVRELRAIAVKWRGEGITVEEPSPELVREIEPFFAAAVERGQLHAAVLLPDEVQLRNPWHLQALVAACEARGVEISSGMEVEEFEIAGGRMRSIRTRHGELAAEQFAICSGAWSGLLLARAGVPIAVKLIRGQIVLLKLPEQALRRVVYVGPHYLVPRDDGRILVGSTLEDVGFDRRNTAAAVRELLDFALAWSPLLQSADVESCWAGLRPASGDGLPYIGKLPGVENAFVGAGHFRSGLIQAPGTAVLLAQLMHGEPTALDLHPFRPEREVVHGR
jgi:glycine oxidase